MRNWMKKVLTLALAAALAAGLGLPASAVRIGEVVGYALHTDIVAQINGHLLRSFNVNSRTAIVAEDLLRYGFRVTWNAEQRTLAVERALDSRQEPLIPENWPNYVPDPLAAPIGSRARAILSTDIVTYVAGKQVESFNIDGETLIWFSDLSPYGAVTWSEEARTASLTLGDPMQIALDRMIQNLEDFCSATGSSSSQTPYTIYSYEYGPASSCQYGALFVGYYHGTPHGTSCSMVLVKPNGTTVGIAGLLPGYGWGADYYLNPRDIRFEGDKLLFITPVMEWLDYGAGTYKIWGDTQCTVDLTTGEMVSMVPLYGEIDQWDVYYEAETWPEGFNPPWPPLSDGTVSLTVTKQDGEPNAQVYDGGVPSYFMNVTATQNGLCIYHQAGLFDESFDGTPYGQLYSALQALALPRVSDDPFSPVNAPEQREQAAQYFRVTLNGEPVPGNLWWGQGNNHVDLNFDFDQPVPLSDGDVLELWLGLPSQA